MKVRVNIATTNPNQLGDIYTANSLKFNGEVPVTINFIPELNIGKMTNLDFDGTRWWADLEIDTLPKLDYAVPGYIIENRNIVSIGFTNKPTDKTLYKIGEK